MKSKTSFPTSNQWHAGRLLAFSALDGQVPFNQSIVARTAKCQPALEILLPERALLIPKSPLKSPFFQSGDFIEWNADGTPGFAAFIDAARLLLDGDWYFEKAPKNLKLQQGNGKTVVGLNEESLPEALEIGTEQVAGERRRFLESLAIDESDFSKEEWKALLVAASIMKTQVCSPEGNIRHRWLTPDRWPHRGMWLWDSCFQAIGWRHFDNALAKEALEAIIFQADADGFIPHMITPFERSKVTQPPLLAMTAELLHDSQPDDDWLRKIYPTLILYLEWDLKHRVESTTGLLKWQIDNDPKCRSGESGLDNSPRFDDVQDLAAVDFNSYLASEFLSLARIASLLKIPQDQENWLKKFNALRDKMIDSLWDEKTGIYRDFDVVRGQQSPVLACTSFLPLFAGIASEDQASRLVKHLLPGGIFHTPLRVASISNDDDMRYEKDMWRGPVWININWMIIEGLSRYGFDELAQELREETLRHLITDCEKHGTFFEFYDDRDEVDPPSLNRKGSCRPDISPYHQVIHDFGWSATLFVDLILRRP